NTHSLDKSCHPTRKQSKSQLPQSKYSGKLLNFHFLHHSLPSIARPSLPSTSRNNEISCRREAKKAEFRRQYFKFCPSQIDFTLKYSVPMSLHCDWNFGQQKSKIIIS
ncbi:hypothetical protein KI387_023282, partial [Taxus chinensis]